MKNAIPTVLGLILGVTMFALTYKNIEPKVKDMAERFRVEYMQPMVDKLTGYRPEVVYIPCEKECKTFECLHKRTI
jgi:hypothetical protein